MSFAVSAVSLALIPRPAAAGSMAATPAAEPLAAEPPGKPLGMLAYIRQSRAMQVILVVAVAANLTNGGLDGVALPALAHAH